MKRALLCWLAGCIPAFAGLAFDEPAKNVTTDADAQSVTLDFTFTNTGTTGVKIDHYDPDCKCMTATLKGGKTFYKPGEKGLLQAVIDLSGFSGTVHKEIGIWLDGAVTPTPAYLLDIHVNIPVLMDIQPRTVLWDIKEVAEAKKVTIDVKGDDPIRILSVSDSPKFQHELKTIEEGRKYELTFVPATTEKPDLAPFRIETDSPTKRYKVQQVIVGVHHTPTPEELKAAGGKIPGSLPESAVQPGVTPRNR